MKLARRSAQESQSPLRAVLAGAPADALPMALGEPGWALPEPARLALARFEGQCSYGPFTGLPELREAIADRSGATADQVMIGAGSQGVLSALFQCWLEPGDQALVPDPGYLAYPILTRLAGAEPVPYPLARDNSLDPDAFLAALDRAPNARVAVLNHPGNPTGAGATVRALAAVAEAAEARGLLLLSDEVYRELCLGPQAPSLRDVSATGVVLGSVSKAWAAPGLRVGWAVGDPAWLAPASIMHVNMVATTARTSQLAALALLEASDTVLPEAREHLRRRWEAFAGAYREHFGAEPRPSAGAFYHWQALPASAPQDPLAFCLRLRDEGGVLTVPGTAFGERGWGYVRMSYACDPEQVREGVRRLAPFWR